VGFAARTAGSEATAAVTLVAALARQLLDLGDAATAYQVVREAPVPANPYFRAEFHFMPG
jgi:hypothetical protein